MNAGRDWAGWLAKGWSELRSKPNVAVFGMGLLLFLVGVVNLIGDQLDSPSAAGLEEEQSPSPPALASRVGPVFGEPVDAYIARRRSVTSDRASKVPRDVTYGLVVFNSYRQASEVEALLQSRGLEPVSLLTRIPLPGFQPRQSSLEGRTVTEAALADREELSRDLAVLEEIAAEVTAAEFKEVYARDLQLHREALGQLGDDPATVYAVVVRGTNQAMGRTATAAQVRYVDLPHEPTDTPEDTAFVALLPEDTATSSVGPVPEESPPPA